MKVRILKDGISRTFDSPEHAADYLILKAQINSCNVYAALENKDPKVREYEIEYLEDDEDEEEE